MSRQNCPPADAGRPSARPPHVSRCPSALNETHSPCGGELTIRQTFLTPVVNTLLRFRPCPEVGALSSCQVSARSIHRSRLPPAACSLCRSRSAPAFCWQRPFGGCGEKQDARAVAWCRRSGRGLGAACTCPTLIHPAAYAASSSRRRTSHHNAGPAAMLAICTAVMFARE